MAREGPEAGDHGLGVPPSGTTPLGQDGIFERAADAGDTFALVTAADCLTDAGRWDEAQNLRRYGREPDRLIAAPWVAI